MIDCICIDDKKRPFEIPISKWVTEGEKYRITYACRVLPQNVLAFSLYEKPLDESCAPFEYFISTRFAIAQEDVEALLALYKDAGDCISEEELKKLFDNSLIETLS